ncbi:hypothetical protein R1sor_003324 [Riccia sorocarpa]|uniref:glucomannan 4-beta-mannosyltransferase n=1 Tax=Riccia sorocarpa TaxID=122646 RepID=A0ABD3H3Z9_9MARC
MARLGSDFKTLVQPASNEDMVETLSSLWMRLRAPVIAPIVQFAINFCLVMVLMLFLERIYMCVVLVYSKLFRRSPQRMYKFEPMRDDVELGNSHYPMVLVQVPMYNEREVFQLSIGAACGLAWPADRIIIQILDDSTDPEIKAMVQAECQRWAGKGINIKYEVRQGRSGYKAGALREGMKRSYVRLCDYVAIFDADFQPESDFLNRTIPYLVHNPDVGLVQARWKFVNGDECLMTKMQEMSLNFHFSCEQTVGATAYAFFGFNGTAGVWRIHALNEAGGWKDRTTVEDMDLAVRASLKGWKFVYLNDLTVKNELPSVFKAYRYQQHRWSCGPANLFRKIVPNIVANKKVKPIKKFHIIYSFFFVRKIVAHIVTFVFYCVVIPTAVLVPECDLPVWGAIYVPTFITFMNAAATPRSLHLLVFWILFENVMSMHRTKATFIGLFDVGNVNEWIVTEKLGSLVKYKTAPKASQRKWLLSTLMPKGFKFGERIHVLELVMGCYLLFCASVDFFFEGKNHFYIYLFLQSMAFFVMGFGYIGTIVPH